MKIRGQIVYTLDERLRRLSILNTESGCVEWIGTTRGGYGRLMIGSRSSNSRKSVAAHRLAWELSNGTPVPKEMYVCHECDNRSCINPKHLFLGTHQDNVDDRELKGRNKPPKKGESHNKSKLTWEKVKEIRVIGNSMTQKKLGKLYNVHRSIISDVLNRKTWKQPPTESKADE